MVPRYGWTGLSPITKATISASCWAAMHKQSACSWWSLMVSGGSAAPICPPCMHPLRSAAAMLGVTLTAALWCIRGADKQESDFIQGEVMIGQRGMALNQKRVILGEICFTKRW